MHSSTHRTLLAIAVLVLSVAMLVRALPEARGQGISPTVIGGEAPWVSFGGTTTTGSTVYTVPSDRAFVMTGACIQEGSSSYGEVDVYEGSSLKINKWVGAGHCYSNGGGFLGKGKAHLVFESGSTVRLIGDHGDPIYYAIQGYLAHP